MSIEQTIYDVIELSRRSQVPFLLFSNPGYGKTTIINKWAKENGYHVEVLIGSRFTPEEIMGYQVNEPGTTSLVHKNPKWYDTIMEYKAKGIPSLLFEDEISTCPDYVQGALLDLNFSRSIGNGNKLPDDCLVLAAANYSRNLPDTMNIITPSLNRFCLINLLEGSSNLDIVNEFLQPSKGATGRRFLPFTEENKEKFNKKFYEEMKNFIAEYSDPTSSKGYLDFQNTDMGNLYIDSEKEVYNVMTGRSLSFLSKVAATMTQLGISDKELVYQVCSGLAGEGTNSFKTEEQKESFRASLALKTGRIITNFLSTEKATLNTNGMSLVETITALLQENQKTNSDISLLSSLPVVLKKAESEYGDVIETAKKFESGEMTDVEKSQYTSGLDAMQELFTVVSSLDSSNEYAEKLKKIHMSHLAFYCDLNDIPLTKTLLTSTYGVSAPKGINELRVVQMKKAGKFNGELKLCARKKHGDRELFYEVDINGDENLAEISISKIVSKDMIEKMIVAA